MNVLSLFDGMSCGQIALQRAGIKVDKYYASELDKYAITVATANWLNMIQLGDVTKWREWDIDWASIGLVIGGSPCQGFSFAGKQLAFDDPRSKLFFVYMDILNHIKSLNPNVKFLLENVKMKQQFQDVITDYIGVGPVEINSALVSAQNRRRLYWTNIWRISQPDNKGIVLKDILDYSVDTKLSPKAMKYMSSDVGRSHNNGKTRLEARTKQEHEKANTITANQSKGVPYGVVKIGRMVGGRLDPITGKRADNNLDIKPVQRIEPRNDNKSGTLTTVTKDNLVIRKVINVHPSGRGMNGWVYDTNYKAPTLTTNKGEGSKVSSDGIYYRTLTPLECERLQTVPDNYTSHVSNSQRYKMLGNGWTVDVIAHILRGLIPGSVESQLDLFGN